MEYNLFILFFSCFTLLCDVESYQPEPIKCNRRNELSRCVYDCPPEKTCKTRGIRFNCLSTSETCQQKCVCKEGFYRNAVGDCVSNKDCERCPGDHEYYSCSGACDNVCSQLHKQNKTNCPIVNIKCNEKCYCEDGYARDDNNVCVPIDKCPAHLECTGPNEEYKACKTTCPPELCISIAAFFNCKDDPPCSPGCACKEGHLRRKEDEPCMPLRQCPELANSPDFQDKLE